jgi:hypothetical protein
MRRLMMVAALTALMVMAASAPAFAGEWNKGHFNAPGGDLPAKSHGNSECLFNGQDEPDESTAGAEDGEGPGPEGYDDGLWSTTPAGAHNNAGIRVQSGGQLVALGFVPPGAQGQACNGHLNPLK